MQLSIQLALTVLLTLSVSGIERPETARFEVTAERVNLRVRPDDHSEVVGQAAYGDLISVKSQVDGWAEISMPQSLDAWVHSEFIEDNAVMPKQLNVRGGPGINYQVIGRLDRGTRVVARGEISEWLKIQPPGSVSIWISDKFIRPIPVPGKTKKVNNPPSRKVTSPASSPVVPVVRAVQPRAVREDLGRPEKSLPPPEGLTLIPLPGQGRLKEVSGVLIKTGFLFGRPADYRIVRSEKSYQETLCYVDAEPAQVSAFLGSLVTINGHEYWYEGGRVPVLVLKEIEGRRLHGVR
jgi:SH3-like domain-containing protein